MTKLGLVLFLGIWGAHLDKITHLLVTSVTEWYQLIISGKQRVSFLVIRIKKFKLGDDSFLVIAKERCRLTYAKYGIPLYNVRHSNAYKEFEEITIKKGIKFKNIRYRLSIYKNQMFGLSKDLLINNFDLFLKKHKWRSYKYYCKIARKERLKLKNNDQKEAQMFFSSLELTK